MSVGPNLATPKRLGNSTSNGNFTLNSASSS